MYEDFSAAISDPKDVPKEISFTYCMIEPLLFFRFI